MDKMLFGELEAICQRPRVYEKYTALELWNDPYVSAKMLEAHLNPDFEPASRNKAFVDRSVEWIAKRFNVKAGVAICDFGCGPGLYTTPFSAMGADVTGIDFSERSIKYARQQAKEKNLSVVYEQKNYLDFSSAKKFDLLLMIYCDFCVLSPAQRATLLKKFRGLLNDGGFLFMDVSSLAYFDSMKESDMFSRSSDADFWSNFWSDKPYFVFTNAFRYEDEKVGLTKYTIIEASRVRTIFNWLQCYSLDKLKQEFQENGLEIVEHYSNVAGDPYKSDAPEFAVVARAIK